MTSPPGAKFSPSNEDALDEPRLRELAVAPGVELGVDGVARGRHDHAAVRVRARDEAAQGGEAHHHEQW